MLNFSSVFVMLVVVLESLAVDLPLALGQVRGEEVLRVAVANVQEFPTNDSSDSSADRIFRHLHRYLMQCRAKIRSL